MNGRIKDISGQVFGRLTAIEYVGSTPKTKLARWRCLCSCGKEKIVVGLYLKQGRIQSCGCLHKEQLADRNRSNAKHGMWSTYYRGGFSSTDLNRWYHHKMSPDEFKRRSESQNNECIICKEEKPLFIDHDHKHCAGRESCEKCWRGLICRECNTGLGAFGDNIVALRNAAGYLEKFRDQ